jgi:catechol 2,3-dioxygenase-like lactoylglutathione lyase family enzyme
MELNHIGITNKSEKQALQFYQDFLGLEKTREILLAPELSEQLFFLSQEIKVLVFEKPGIKIEVFISDFQHAKPNFTHFGIMVDNFSEVTEKARRSHVDIIMGKHKDKTVYFLKDFSGNLIEIKQKPQNT